MLDENAYGRWLRTAGGHVDVAEHAAGGGFHSAAVLHAEQAAQRVLKALLHGVGENTLARGHGLVELAEACSAHAALVLADEVRGALLRLARDYLPTRYPDALPGGTPMEHYGPSDASTGLETARQVVAAVEAAWAALVAAAADEAVDGGSEGDDT